MNFPFFKFAAKLRRSPRVSLRSLGGRVFVFPFKVVSLFLIVGLAGLSVFLALRSDLFLVRNIKINVSGDNLAKGFVEISTIRESLQKYAARSIFFLDEEEVVNSVKSFSLVIKSVKAAKLFPDTIIIYIKLRNPAAEVGLTGERFLIDEDGFVFARSPSNIALPRFELSPDQNISLGESLNSVFAGSTIKVITDLQEKGLLKIKTFALQKDGAIVVTAENGLSVYFKSGTTVSDQLVTLEAILAKAKTEKGKLVKVDFRFERPIVVFQ